MASKQGRSLSEESPAAEPQGHGSHPKGNSDNELLLSSETFVTASQLLQIQKKESSSSQLLEKNKFAKSSNQYGQHDDGVWDEQIGIGGEKQSLPKRRKIHMDMSDCLHLSQSEKGAVSLTIPNAIRNSSKDPNRGLYPKMPRLKTGSASGKGFVKASNMMGPELKTFLPNASSRENISAGVSETSPINFHAWGPPGSHRQKSGPARKLKGPPQSNTLSQYFGVKSAIGCEQQSQPAGSDSRQNLSDSLSPWSPRTVASVAAMSDIVKTASPQLVSQDSVKKYQFSQGISPSKKVSMFSPVKKLSDSSAVYVIDSSPESSPKSSQESNSSSTCSTLQSAKSASSGRRNLFGSQKLPNADNGNHGTSTNTSKSSQKKSTSTRNKKPAPRFNRDNAFLYSKNPLTSDGLSQGIRDTYGLLGNGNRLKKSETQRLENDICYFAMLPVEVLENILCMMPMMDLCLNVNRVCQQWNSIISNPKFLPWKKQYHQVKLQITPSVSEVVLIMTKNGMTDTASYLPALIRYMRDFKPVTACNMSECLKKHKKYTWVENLLQERLPECIQNEIPNPWSVVTGLVFVSEFVGDVQEIIQCLLGGESQCTAMEVLECLYCIALFLSMFKMFKVADIWNRLHYLVYYALYLFENTSSSTSAELSNAVSNSTGQQSLLKYSSGDTSVRMTHEQLRICNHDMQHGSVVKIIAFAGTGKTTTLVKYTQLRPNKKFLLVVYNRSVCDHAKTKFPSNVDCKTGHSLAFATIGRRYAAKNKLSGGLKINEILDHFKAEKGESLYVQAKFIIDTLNNFMASDQEFITTAHVPAEKVDVEKGVRKPVEHHLKMHYVECATHIWKKMIKLDDSSIRITHDTYLKLYHLSKPQLRKYDIILIDEAQDLTPAIADLLLSQSQAKLLVGDPHQQIYSFRGAVNAMQQVEATHTFYLTQSFRFGPEIAYVASSCLELLKGERKNTLVGNGIPGGIRGDRVGQLAIITRCNFTLFNEAVKKCCFSDDKDKVAFVGGTKAFGFDMILDIYTLMLSPEDQKKEGRCIKHPLVRRFPSFGELEKFATKTMDSELLGKIRIVKTHHNSIPSHVNRILSRCIGDTDTADVVLSTAHKAKGLEFSTVRLTDDFNLVPKQGLDLPIALGQQMSGSVDESNLLYVAVTRAKKRLQLTPTLNVLLHMVGEDFIYPLSTKSLLSSATPMKCCVTDRDFEPCALTMVKRVIKMGDGTEKPGGVICPQVVREEHTSMQTLLGSLKDERESSDRNHDYDPFAPAMEHADDEEYNQNDHFRLLV